MIVNKSNFFLFLRSLKRKFSGDKLIEMNRVGFKLIHRNNLRSSEMKFSRS